MYFSSQKFSTFPPTWVIMPRWCGKFHLTGETEMGFIGHLEKMNVFTTLKNKLISYKVSAKTETFSSTIIKTKITAMTSV